MSGGVSSAISRVANGWEYVPLEAAKDVGGMARGPLRFRVFVALASATLERLPGCLDVRFDPELLDHRRITAFAEDRIRLVSLGARLRQGNERIGAEGHGLVLAIIIIVPAPELAAARRDEQH